MFSIIFEGFELILEYKDEILFLVTGMCAGEIIAINTGMFDDLDGIFKYITVLGTGFLILVGVTFSISFLSVLSEDLFRAGCYFILLFSIFILIYNAIIDKANLKNIRYIISATLLFLLSTTIHLPYLKKVILPSYSDSAVHYQIIHQILFSSEEPLINLAIENIFINYYHLGYHGLTAWISVLSGTPIERNMSFIGQISLALVPISIAFVSYTLSKNKIGAFYAGILSVFGWVMPAFAVNWGKFPALLALSTVSNVAGLMILLSRKTTHTRTSLMWIILLILCITIIHTRILILVVLLAIIIFLIKILKIPRQITFPRAILYSILFTISTLPLAGSLTTYFNGPTLGIILLFLLPFAFQKHLRSSTGIFIFVAGLWVTRLFFSMVLPGRFQPLDDQFIDISLFIPFSILGGLEVSAVINRIPKSIQFALIFFLILVTSYQSPWQTSLTPDSCCILYNQDDREAFQWIMTKTKTGDLFIISTLNDNQQHGTDAGVWISALTHRNTNKRPYNTKWSNTEGLPNSCNPDKKNIFIYSGGKLHSFSVKSLSSINWVEKVFTFGDVNIFKVLNCSS